MESPIANATPRTSARIYTEYEMENKIEDALIELWNEIWATGIDCSLSRDHISKAGVLALIEDHRKGI